MWNSGDKLNRRNLNRKTLDIARGVVKKNFGAGGANAREPIYISNETGAALVLGEVCEVKEGYVVDEHVDGKGTAIDADTTHDRVFIALQAIDEDGAGFAVSVGTLNCIVNVTDVDHEYCMWEDGEARLQSQEGKSRYRIIEAALDGGETPTATDDAPCLIVASESFDPVYDVLFFRQEDSDLPALGEKFPVYTHIGPDAKIMAVRVDRNLDGITGEAATDYEFKVDVEGSVDTKLDNLDLSTNKYFQTGVDVVEDDQITLETITAEPDANAQGVEVRLMIVYDKAFPADLRARFGGTEEVDP